jgi:hypothetical protein
MSSAGLLVAAGTMESSVAAKLGLGSAVVHGASLRPLCSSSIPASARSGVVLLLSANIRLLDPRTGQKVMKLKVCCLFLPSLFCLLCGVLMFIVGLNYGVHVDCGTDAAAGSDAQRLGDE